MRIWVYSGRPSESAAFLADQDGFHRNRTGNYIKQQDVIVNWGTTGKLIPGSITGCRILNKPEAVAKAINKRTTFQVLAGADVQTVPWTANMDIAKQWLDNGFVVVARKTLTGSEGAGIIIVEKVNELIQAPLYTQYVHKVKEFRVHATQFGVIDTQQKVHDPKLGPPKSWKVRSYANGFIFQRKGIIPSQVRDALAVQTVKALGLDFAGLDIIEDKKGNFYVVEANTAPGIEGTTVTRYASALKELAGQHLAAVVAPKPINRAPPVQHAGPGLRNLNLGWAA